MSTAEELDRSLVEFAQKIAAIPKGIADEDRATEPPPVASRAAPPAAAEVGSQSLPPPLPAGERPDPDVRPATPAGVAGKQVRNAEEIAGIVMKSLRTIDGCPNRGFVVTVYGSNPWNAMLTIRPEAGTPALIASFGVPGCKTSACGSEATSTWLINQSSRQTVRRSRSVPERLRSGEHVGYP
jgi:hypothetical protein